MNDEKILLIAINLVIKYIYIPIYFLNRIRVKPIKTFNTFISIESIDEGELKYFLLKENQTKEITNSHLKELYSNAV